MDEYNKLLTQKELAAAVRRGLRSVQRDIANGFEMPGGLATVNEWREFKRAQMRRRHEENGGACAIVEAA